MKIQFFRSLFPHWNFFDRIGYAFDLEVKSQGSSTWQKVVFRQKRTLLGLFFNPDDNLTLSEVNILEHFAGEVQDSTPSNTINLATYKMIKSLLELQFGKISLQFKIVGSNKMEKVDIYVSDLIKLG
jgi:hypothetical protein